LLIGLEIAAGKGSKGHEEFMLRDDKAFVEILIASEWLSLSLSPRQM
jgi:hypothetical protein